MNNEFLVALVEPLLKFEPPVLKLRASLLIRSNDSLDRAMGDVLFTVAKIIEFAKFIFSDEILENDDEHNK